MGRPPKPVQMQLIEGNKNHLTKAEIEWREEMQIHLGDREYSAPEIVLQNQDAIAKWNELKTQFDKIADAELVTSTDVALLARYCLTWAEYLELKRLYGLCCAWKTGRKPTARTFDRILKLNNAIARKSVELIRLEDRLFLTPLSKVKNIPKQPDEKPDGEQLAFAFPNV